MLLCIKFGINSQITVLWQYKCSLGVTLVQIQKLHTENNISIAWLNRALCAIVITATVQ